MGKGHRTCEVCGIKERHTGEVSLHFFKCPLDPSRCREWLKAVGNEELVHLPIEKLHEQRYICGNHFHKKDFNKTGNRLNKYATPTLNLMAAPLTDGQLAEFPQHMGKDVKDDLAEPGPSTSRREDVLVECIKKNMLKTDRKAYKRHKYSGPRKCLSRVRAGLKQFHDETSRAAIWREEAQDKNEVDMDITSDAADAHITTPTEHSTPDGPELRTYQCKRPKLSQEATNTASINAAESAISCPQNSYESLDMIVEEEGPAPAPAQTLCCCCLTSAGSTALASTGLADMLNFCFNITYPAELRATSSVCRECVTMLRDAVNFKKRALNCLSILTETEIEYDLSTNNSELLSTICNDNEPCNASEHIDKPICADDTPITEDTIAQTAAKLTPEDQIFFQDGCKCGKNCHKLFAKDEVLDFRRKSEKYQSDVKSATDHEDVFPAGSLACAAARDEVALKFRDVPVCREFFTYLFALNPQQVDSHSTVAPPPPDESEVRVIYNPEQVHDHDPLELVKEEISAEFNEHELS